ncbi:uncharacterized protein EDB93DRAFT_1336715 [Suillus bovinus]|uniref:uncharacterized protein n=1 Tax=Suillus bovinus TaxID=48563 RepID=UPI001B87CF62|nr:uncharacterized protein EDB93DRAFT_1336715 [Suillus bovinus]KAG2151220.1 hypothetical protein EDB93DRAFT_1336715 [Suillus bovinus]
MAGDDKERMVYNTLSTALSRRKRINKRYSKLRWLFLLDETTIYNIHDTFKCKRRKDGKQVFKSPALSYGDVQARTESAFWKWYAYPLIVVYKSLTGNCGVDDEDMRGNTKMSMAKVRDYGFLYGVLFWGHESIRFCSRNRSLNGDGAYGQNENEERTMKGTEIVEFEHKVW